MHRGGCQTQAAELAAPLARGGPNPTGGAAAAAAHAAAPAAPCHRLRVIPRALAGPHAAPTPLQQQEDSAPITPEQRPDRERRKKLAQDERERAALQMSLAQLQLFVQRETDMEIANQYGYP